jgi:hypothetical protein
MVKQRNARLADALGIKTEGRGETVWPEDLKAFATANHQFVKTVEATFRDFFSSSRQTLVLPHSEFSIYFFWVDIDFCSASCQANIRHVSRRYL